MTVIEAVPVRQWIVLGELTTIRANLQNSLDDLHLAISEDEENNSNRSGREADLCLSSQDWGNLGRIQLVTLDQTQILLAIYLPLYPSEEEVLIYESRVREAIPPPAFMLRIFDMYGPEKVREYLRKILHQFRLQTLDHLYHEMAQVLEGVLVEGIKSSDILIKTLSDPPALASKDIPKEYPEHIPTSEQYPIGNIPAPGSDDQNVIQLWKDGRSAKSIAQLAGKTEKTVHNRISFLRKIYGEQAVPRRRK
jgi:hypothetical protein